MTRQRNAVLETLLDEFGYTHRSLAEAVNREAGAIFGKAGDCTDRHVRRWVSGEVRWPWTKYLLPLERIFNRPPQAMGFVPRGRNSATLPRPPRPAVQEESVQRRRFIAATAATTVSAALGLDQTPTRGRLSMSDVDRVDQTIGRLCAHFNAVGGGALYAVSTDYLARLRGALDSCTYGPRVERALHSALAALCSSAGWAAHDAGHRDQARALYADALQYAILAADKRGQARAWSNLAMQARVEGRHREALRVNRAALESRQARQDPRIAALLHSRLAIGHARAGDHAAAGRSIAAAEIAHDRFDTAPPCPPWLRFLDAAEISGLTAIAHRAMGRLPDAEAATVQALQLMPAAMRRNRAYYEVQLAGLQAAQGNLERARTTVARIDTSALSSQQITARLTAIHDALG